jgi:putative ABC transport system permease protein
MNPITTLLTVAGLAIATFAIVRMLRLEHPWLQPWAILRVTVQLAILSVILGGIISSPVWVGAFLLVMVGAAVWTVFRRLKLGIGALVPVAVTIVLAAAVPIAVIFLAHAIDFTPRYVLAVGGIVIGGAMTVSTLMGRSLGSLLVSQRDEIEGWLALGATPRRAAQRAVRSSGSTALIPATDQTRTTGVVTLPGSFVGAIFAGASPLAAAQFQLIVLVGILLSGAVAVACFTVAFGAPRFLPLEERALR